MVDSNIEGTYELREFEFLDGKKVKMKDGYFAVTKSTTGNGYHICYYCNQCLSGWADTARHVSLRLALNKLHKWKLT